MELFYKATEEAGLSDLQLARAVLDSLRDKKVTKALLLPPDFTRYHSNAGLLTNLYYHALKAKGAQVDIMPALGTHVAMTDKELSAMFGDVPHEHFLVHNWRKDVVKLGEVPAEYLSEISEGLWNEPMAVELNKRLLDPSYDLILSIGQVVPHEVIGMSNQSKNLFVGVGGADMIHKSHMLGAVYGMERMMGRDHTPVRKAFDYALEHFCRELPILFALTVTTAPGGVIHTHGLFISEGRRGLEEAIALAQEKNLDFVPPLKKCVVYLTPEEFHSTWLGNKAVYRTRMAMADGGELIILAPGIERFGEDEQVDALIRKYGYKGRLNTLAAFKQPENRDLRENMGAAAHLIHGSSDGRFSITYCTKSISKEEIEAVGFNWADYDTAAKRYDPNKLAYGFNTLPDGEEVFFIPNPALGLWTDRERFEGK